jgi:ribonuclease HI
MPRFDLDTTDPTEWEIARRAVRACLAEEGEAVEALAHCPSIEAYTDGSAPLANPGGPAGFGAVILGFGVPLDVGTSHRPSPVARLNIAAHLPARDIEPLTSGYRAELAALLATLEVLRSLGRGGWAAEQVFIWSDSDYVVKCGNGVWKRTKNNDLWSVYNRVAQDVAGMAPGGVVLRWAKGQASTTYNRAADELATRAAFDFDAISYGRYRAAQRRAPRDMPAAGSIVSVEPAPDHLHDFVSQSRQDSGRNVASQADYSVLVRIHRVGYDTTGIYRLETKGGRSFQAEVTHSGQRIHDEAEYLTLIRALDDLLERINRTGRQPDEYTLKVYSCRRLVVDQLTERVPASSLLKPSYLRARQMLRQFKNPQVIWKPYEDILQGLDVQERA